MGAWSIIEEGREDYGRDMGFRSYEEEEAYKRGCRHGYEKAMREIHEEMGYREGYGRRDYGRDGMSGERRFPGYMPESPYMGYRDYDEIGERRRRDSRGRFM